MTGKIHYFCTRQNPTDQQVPKAVNNCSADGVLLCDAGCFHDRQKVWRNVLPPLQVGTIRLQVTPECL